ESFLSLRAASIKAGVTLEAGGIAARNGAANSVAVTEATDVLRSSRLDHRGVRIAASSATARTIAEKSAAHSGARYGRAIAGSVAGSVRHPAGRNMAAESDRPQNPRPGPGSGAAS